MSRLYNGSDEMNEIRHISPWHPLRSTALSGPDVGWFRPAAAVVIGLIFPNIIALLLVWTGHPTFVAPVLSPADIKGANHIAFTLGLLSVSFLVSWMAAPFALFMLRGAAMLGFASWGIAIVLSLAIGLPIVHVALNGDLTTETNTFWPHISVAIGILGFSVWGTFTLLCQIGRKRTIGPHSPKK